MAVASPRTREVNTAGNVITRSASGALELDDVRFSTAA